MSKVILVSPPYMKLSYPSYDMPLALTKGCNYMNPGLLICSSVLEDNNISNKIVKIDDINNDEILKHIDDDTILVGISCTCAWEYLESLKIAETIKKKYSDIKIVMSGWQIKSIKEKTFIDSSDVDYLILGDAEYTIAELYNNVKNGTDNSIPSVITRKNTENKNACYPKVEFTTIDFKKFPNYLDYFPYVEESRNCPYSCKFCLNSCVQDNYQIVPFETFKRNVELLEEIYGKNANASLLAANFGVNYDATKEKLEYLKTKDINWNIELHVDNCWEKYIDDLKEAGINKVSIGFESGSPKILKMMNKSKNPEKYLLRLEKMLLELNKYGIKPSLNLLFDYREDYETIAETLRFLEKNKTLIKKVKGNFMFAFEGLLNSIDFSYNPNIIIDYYGKKIHAYPILPSGMTLQEISYIISEVENGNYNLKILNDIKAKQRVLQ